MYKRVVFAGLSLVFLAAPFVASADVNCPTLSRTLARGSRGNDVVQLQHFLIAQGSLQSGLASGYFGALTEAGVKSWQSKNALDSVGVVGPKTRAAIKSQCGVVATSPQPHSGAPLLTSISPSSGPVGRQVTITGQRLGVWNDRVHQFQVLLDGKYGLGEEGRADITATSSTFTFTLPGYMYSTTACENLAAMMTCEPGLVPILVGQHSFSVKNANGTSNALTYTVTPFQGTATIDQGSLIQSAGHPTITGTASGVSVIDVEFVGGRIHALGKNPISVLNGRWSIQLSYVWPYDATNTAFPPGTYYFEVVDDNTRLRLATSTLTVQ